MSEKFFSHACFSISDKKLNYKAISPSRPLFLQTLPTATGTSRIGTKVTLGKLFPEHHGEGRDMFKIRGLLVTNTIILIYDLQIIEFLQLIGFSNFKNLKI
jgi:hypothetical protein